MKFRLFSLLFITFFLFSCNQPVKSTTGSSSHAMPDSVITGAQVLIQKYVPYLKGKRIGIVGNATSQVAGVPLVDTLLSLGVNVTALFGPEHGFTGYHQGSVKNGEDAKAGIPIYSLYGKTANQLPRNWRMWMFFCLI